MLLHSYIHPWIVTFFGALSAGLSVSYFLCIHLFMEEFRKTFNVSYKEASLVSALGLVQLNCSLIAHIFTTYVGFRKTVVGAALMCTLAQIGAAYSQNFTLVIVLLGFVNGLGVSLAFHSPILAASNLFPENGRHRAIAVVLVGSGFGMLILPMVYEALMLQYGFRGTLLVLSGISLNGVVAGVAMPNVKAIVYRHRPDSVEKLGRLSIFRKLYKKLDDLLHFSLLWQPKLHFLNLACFLMAACAALAHSFSLSILIKDYGLRQKTAAIVVAVSGGMTLLGKFLVIFAKKTKWIPRWFWFSLDGALLGAFMVIIGSPGSLNIYGAIFAFTTMHITFGAVYSLHIIVLTDLYPMSSFASVYSYNVFAMMIASMLTPVLSGWLVDITGTFSIPLIAVGATKLLIFLLPVVKYFADTIRMLYQRSQKLSLIKTNDPCTPSIYIIS